MNSNELLNIIKKRRAVQPISYSQEEITDEELQMILESARWAPNHKRTEPWRYKIVQGEARQRFAEFLIKKYEENTPAELQSERKKQDLANKPLKSDKIILICMQNSPILPEWEELAATAMSVQNMWLMCTAIGIGAYWSSPSMIHDVNEFTELAPDEKCIGFFYMGKLNTQLIDGVRKPIEQSIQFINN